MRDDRPIDGASFASRETLRDWPIIINLSSQENNHRSKQHSSTRKLEIEYTVIIIQVVCRLLSTVWVYMMLSQSGFLQ